MVHTVFVTIPSERMVFFSYHVDYGTAYDPDPPLQFGFSDPHMSFHLMVHQTMPDWKDQESA